MEIFALLLMEDGSYLLQEDDYRFILEPVELVTIEQPYIEIRSFTERRRF